MTKNLAENRDPQTIDRFKRLRLDSKAIHVLATHGITVPTNEPLHSRSADHFLAAYLRPMLAIAGQLEEGQMSQTLRSIIQIAVNDARRGAVVIYEKGIACALTFNSYALTVERDPEFRHQLQSVFSRLMQAYQADPFYGNRDLAYAEVCVAALFMLKTPRQLSLLESYLDYMNSARSPHWEEAWQRDGIVDELVSAINAEIPAAWFMESVGA